MADSIATLASIFTLLGTASFMIVVGLVFSGFKFFKPLVSEERHGGQSGNRHRSWFVSGFWNVDGH